MTVLSKAPPGSKSQDSPRGQVLHTTCEMQALTPWGNRRGPLRGLFLSESVSRILSGAAIHLCGPPGPRRAGSEVLLGLAPGGVCHARHVTVPPVRSYRTLSPLPVRDSAEAAPSAVCSLRHFPAGFPGWALPTAMPFGVRTFLEDSFRHLRDCLTRTPQGTAARTKQRKDAARPAKRCAGSSGKRQASWDPQVLQPEVSSSP